MQCFKTILCTSVLALLMSAGLSGQGEDKLYELQRFHVVPGQEQVLIDEFTKLTEIFREDVNFKWAFVQYDDHTFEVTTAIDNLGGLDRSAADF